MWSHETSLNIYSDVYIWGQQCVQELLLYGIMWLEGIVSQTLNKYWLCCPKKEPKGVDHRNGGGDWLFLSLWLLKIVKRGKNKTLIIFDGNLTHINPVVCDLTRGLLHVFYSLDS